MHDHTEPIYPQDYNDPDAADIRAFIELKQDAQDADEDA